MGHVHDAFHISCLFFYPSGIHVFKMVTSMVGDWTEYVSMPCQNYTQCHKDKGLDNWNHSVCQFALPSICSTKLTDTKGHGPDIFQHNATFFMPTFTLHNFPRGCGYWDCT